MNRIIFFLVVAGSCNYLQAQDTHYWTQQFGTRSAMLGGAVVAESKDNTAIFYNPGSLAFMDSNSVSVNANLYRIENTSIDNALGQHKKFKSSGFNSLPLLVSGMIRLKNKRIRLGYGFAAPVDYHFKATVRGDGYYNIVDDTESPGTEETIAQSGVSSKINETQMGIGFGYKLNQHWGIGITALFTARSQDYEKTSLVRFFLNEPGNPLVSSTILHNFTYFHLRFATKIGITYHTDKISVGATVTTPGMRLYGSGVVASDITANNIKLDGITRQDILADDRQGKLKTNFRSPFSASTGVNINFRKSMLGIAVQYYGKEDVYDILRANPAAFVRPAAVYTTLGADDFLRVKGGAKEVVNYVIGYERILNNRLSLDVSLAANNTYYNKDLKNNLGIKPDISTWNIYQAVAGITIHKGASSINLGLTYSFGKDDKHEDNSDISKLVENKLLQSAVTITQANYNAVGFILGYNYSFKKF